MHGFCQYIFKRGENKGKICGKKCVKNTVCSIHKKNGIVANEITSIDDFPILVKSIIINYINNYSIIKAISQTNKSWAEVSYDIFENMFKKLNVSNSQNQMMNVYKLTTRQKLSLLNEIGCQKCGIPRVRVIHWPFPIRCCQSCIQEITTSSYNLLEIYGIKESILKDLTYKIVNTYSSYNNQIFELKCYLNKDVEKRIGFSIKNFKENKIKTNKNKLLNDIIALEKLTLDHDIIYNLLEEYSYIFKNLSVKYDYIVSTSNSIIKEYYTTRFDKICKNHGIIYNDLIKTKFSVNKVIKSADFGDAEFNRISNYFSENKTLIHYEIEYNKILSISKEFPTIKMPEIINTETRDIFYKDVDKIIKLRKKILDLKVLVSSRVYMSLFPKSDLELVNLNIIEFEEIIKKRIIEDNKNTKCNICGRILKNYNGVMQHTKDVHKIII